MAIFLKILLTHKPPVYLWEKILQQEVTNQETETETEVCNFPNRPWEQHKTSTQLLYRTSRFWAQVRKIAKKWRRRWCWQRRWFILNLAYFVIHYNSNRKFRPAWYISFPWQPLWRKEQLNWTDNKSQSPACRFISWLNLQDAFLNSFKGGGCYLKRSQLVNRLINTCK